MKIEPMLMDSVLGNPMCYLYKTKKLKMTKNKMLFRSKKDNEKSFQMKYGAIQMNSFHHTKVHKAYVI